MTAQLCLLFALAQGTDRPQALLALEQSRQAIFSGTVRWTWTPLIRRPGRVFSFVNRYAANGDRVYEERGDQEGWVVWGVDGPISKFPQLYLVNAEGIWRHGETCLSCDLWKWEADLPESRCNPPPEPGEIRDIRYIGIHPASGQCFRHGTEALWFPVEPRPDGTVPEARAVEWSEQPEGGKLKVTAHLDGGSQVTWLIDPERGWNAERIQAETKRGNVFETICELRKYGEVWFPERVTHLVNGEPGEVYEILQGSFNQPDDPPSFSGKDLGLEPGHNVVPQNFRTSHPVLIWEGDKVATRQEWDEAVASGRKKYGPTWQERRRMGGPVSPYMTEEQRRQWFARKRQAVFEAQRRKPLSLWEKYVKKFVERYQLDKEQTQKAYAILRECQKRGLEYIDGKKREFMTVQVEMQEAREEGDAEKLKRLSAKLHGLRAPLDRIFEQQLKPRLEKLPTRKQREQAEAREPPASQPTPQP